MKGHYGPCRQTLNEVWGMCTLKDDDLYITVSDDATIRLWSSEHRRQIAWGSLNFDKNKRPMKKDPKTGELNESARGRCVDIHPNQTMIAVGCKEGTIRVSQTTKIRPNNSHSAIIQKPHYSF